MTADLRALAERAAKAFWQSCDRCNESGIEPGTLDRRGVGENCELCDGAGDLFDVNERDVADAIEEVAREHARQAVEAEREACARIAEDNMSAAYHSDQVAAMIAEQIRARGE